MNKEDLKSIELDLGRQEQWIKDHGGDEAGYVKRYGSKNNPDHYGEGGEAIYKSDAAYLEWLTTLRMKIFLGIHPRFHKHNKR